MTKKKKGILLIIIGLAGILFVSTFDIISGKPINDITGPKSIPALIACGLLVILGITFIIKALKKNRIDDTIDKL